jgi:hypothetical protein
MGQRTGEELCEIYASGDVFGFASFTEVSVVSQLVCSICEGDKIFATARRRKG